LGVRTKPSRVGSSPRRTIISRTRSSKLALVKVDASTEVVMVSLLSYPILAPVFERIHHRLFKPYLFKMSMVKAALQNIVDNNAQILRGWDSSREFRNRVQVLVIEAFQNFASHKSVQIHQIANHPGALIDRAADCDLKRVVVAVSVGVVALSISRSILRL
jgi:hypothetical protein